MNGSRCHSGLRRLTCIARLAVLLGFSLPAFSPLARAQTETVLYEFGSSIPTDGFEPSGALLMDRSGNLFGTTSGGGTAVLCPDPTGPSPCGTVFELVNSSGSYTEKVLYNFVGPPNDGDEPLSGLVMDSSGNLYGTTGYGGLEICGATSCGIVFELVKSSSGYTEQVLHQFAGTDGAFPLAGLIMDSSGNLYGTTNGGGAYGYGAVFELINASGTYTETVLYSFGGNASDSTYPVGGLLMDGAGNLYGTTSLDRGSYACGLSACGTVFELVKTSNGYTERMLYQFTGTDGANPQAGLIVDPSGNLYGTTQAGGVYGKGTVFELVNSDGQYAEKVLYSFGRTPADGTDPISSLVLDASGNLYGTTYQGGSTTACGGYGCGTVFELVNSSGNYAERLLHGFSGGSDGSSPMAALIIDSNGNLYGTTDLGGSSLQLGTVFTINPTAAAPDATLSTTSLFFSNQLINTSSPAQIITVTNSGKANLIFGPNAVALSGDEGTDFEIFSDLCSGTTVAPSATCTVSVTFAPLAAATDNATLTFFDNSVTSLQAVDLTGIGVLPNSPVVALSPASLSFSSQMAASSSTAQTVTLTNTGSAALNISNIFSTSGNFSQTNNCGTSVAAAASCVISVTFTPSTGGSLTGIISIQDNASDSPQGISLSGTGEDFSISLATGAPQSVTVSPGANASYSLSITPTGGFTQSLTLGCSGAPSLATCSVSPSSLTLNGTHALSLEVSVATAAPSIVWRVPHTPFGPIGAGVVCVFSLFALWLAARSGRTFRLRFACLTVLLAAGAMCSSCGGGSSSSQGSPGTPAGTYMLTITGTSGSLNNSVVLTLIVK
jgi:uncharacterized repeat protein (TIGR03803 family)